MNSAILFISVVGIVLSILFAVILAILAFTYIKRQYLEESITCFVGALISILTMFELIVFMGGNL